MLRVHAERLAISCAKASAHHANLAAELEELSGMSRERRREIRAAGVQAFHAARIVKTYNL